MRVAMAEFLTDRLIQTALEDAQLLNWCLQTVKLTAVQTTGDGNCLLHAAAMYIWGVQDTKCVLRQQLYSAMRSDPRGELRERWEHHTARSNAEYPVVQLTQEQWAREWQLMVSMATPESANPVSGQHCYRSLEEFHVFTLANILRRPIIIIADMEGHPLNPVHFGGIYLPLLWQPQDCVRYPVVLAFHNQHFTPLMAEEAAPAPNGPASPRAQEQAIPLTGQDRQLLQVQYLQSNEENRVMVLLRQYLHIEDIPLGDDGRVPAALINGPSVPAELNFITDLLQYDWSGQGAGGAGEVGAPQAEATGSQCSQGAEGLSVSGQHQDQRLLANKLKQMGLADLPPNPSPASDPNPPNPSANAIDAERLVVPTEAPGGTMGSQGGVSQQQNGPPSAGPPPENRQAYAAAVATNLKTPQTMTPKRRPSFPLVHKTSPKKVMRCLTKGCPNTPIPRLGRLCKECHAQKRNQKNRNLSSAPATRKNQRPPSAAGGRPVSAPAKSPSTTMKERPVGVVKPSINTANQEGPGTAGTEPSRAVSTGESYADVHREASRPQVSRASPATSTPATTTTSTRPTQPTAQLPQQGNSRRSQRPGRRRCLYRGCNQNGQEQYGYLCLQHYQRFYNGRANGVHSRQRSDGLRGTLSPQANYGPSTATTIGQGLPPVSISGTYVIVNNNFDQQGIPVDRMIQQFSDAQQVANSLGYQSPSTSSSSASQSSNNSQSTQSSPNGTGRSAPAASPPQENLNCLCGEPGIPAYRHLCMICYENSITGGLASLR